MGELERYGLLSAALLLLMAGLLAFFGRDSADERSGGHVLSANPRTLDRDAGPRPSRDPGADPKPVDPTPPVAKKEVAPTTPIEHERANGDDGEIRPRPPVVTPPSNAAKPEAKPTDPPSEAPVAKEPEPDAPIHYKVKSGDTLSSIAQKHFGDRKYYPLIVSANPGVNPNALQLEQDLILPAKSAIGDAAIKPVVQPDAKSEKPRETKPKVVTPPKSGKSAPGVEPVPLAAKSKTPGVTPKEAALVAADEKTVSKEKKNGDKAAAKKGVREHRVAKGDTLTSIARHYYDDSNKWKVIFEANRDKLKSTSLVPEGVVLKIP